MASLEAMVRHIVNHDRLLGFGMEGVIVHVIYPGELMTQDEIVTEFTTSFVPHPAELVYGSETGYESGLPHQTALKVNNTIFSFIGKSDTLLGARYSEAKVHDGRRQILTINMLPLRLMKKPVKLFHESWAGYRELMLNAYDSAPKGSSFVFSTRTALLKLLEAGAPSPVTLALMKRARSVEDVLFINCISQ